MRRRRWSGGVSAPCPLMNREVERSMGRFLKSGISGILLMGFLCAAAGAAETGWQRLPPQTLARMIAEGKRPLLVDTMSEIECRDHSIAGSLCIPTEEFEERIGEMAPDRDRMLVLYCESETSRRSREAAGMAARQGYQAVRLLEGGMSAWKIAGYQTVSVERIPRRAVPSMKPLALRKRMAEKQGGLLVDIRSEKEFRKERIEGAVNLPMYQLHRRWRELPLDRPLILVDNRGFRSPLASSYLIARGYTVERLFGGMASWKAMTAKEKAKNKRP